MINGSYKEKVNWREFESPLAHGFLQRNSERKGYFDTCGTACLATLTGLKTKHINKFLPKSRVHWSDVAMIKFLNQRGFKTRQVSKFGITNLDPNNSYDWNRRPLNSNHVLLCSMLMCREEASWWIIHRDLAFHNFVVEPLSPLMFVNKPTQSIHLVTHPKWQCD